MTIRIRTILVIILTNFMIILLSILAGTGYVREHIEKYIEADMMVVADIADEFISAELDLLRYEAESAAAALAGQDPAGNSPASGNPTNPANGNPAGLAAILAEQAQRYPKFAGMAVLGRATGIEAAVGERPDAAALLKNPQIGTAFSGQSAFTTTVPTADGVAFYLACPIPGEAGRILVLTLNGMFFSDLVSGYKVWDTGHIFIDDNEGHVIANIRPEWVLGRQNFIRQAQLDAQYEEIGALITKLIAGGRGIDYYSLNGVSRICAYRPISSSAEGWCLGIVAPLSESPARDVDRGIFLIAAVSFLLNVAAAVAASKFIKKPFEELGILKEVAEANSHAKSSFLANMSHEIRTPLNAVVGLSELALCDEGLDAALADKLGKIHSSGMTILSIVNDILDISKIESGNFEIYPARYDTPSLINDIVTLNVVRIGEKPITFRLDLDERLPGALYGDDLRIKQIFNNLLSNAFKYTQAGTVEWRIRFERADDEIWLVSHVRDTGAGIRPEDLKKLFSDYYQVDKKSNRRVEGTGLGLAIAQRLAQTMGGEITVESEYGQGSTFSVRLRQGFVSEAPIGKIVAGNLMDMRYVLSKRTNSAAFARIDMSYAHVLVVDDIATNLEVIKGMLKPYHLRVDCASGGAQAIAMIRSEKPRYGAVFMDHMMPEMDGIETVQAIRGEIGTEYAQNVPIIALTANAIVGNEEIFLGQGFQAFLSKPVDMAKLDTVLRRFVRDKGKEGGHLDAGRLAAEEEGRLAAAAIDGATSAGVGLGEAASVAAAIGGAASAGVGLGEAAIDRLAIDGLDLNLALRRFQGDETLLVDVLRSYAAGTRPLLNSLQTYLAAEDLKGYAIAIHGIKGSSYGVAAQAVGEAARHLEMAAGAGDLAQVMAGHGAFECLAFGLLDHLEQVLGQIAVADNKPLAAAPDPQLLQELRRACEAFDMDRVDRLMEQLESCRYGHGRELVARLRGLVDSMAFEEIAAMEFPAGP